MSNRAVPLLLALSAFAAAPLTAQDPFAVAARAPAGIPTYGILPFPLLMEDELRMHGDNERVPIAALGWATEYLFRVLQRVAEG